MDCRPELQTTDLPHGDGRKKSAEMSGSKKKYIFPHVMGWPSLHIHDHRASITARVIRVLALTSCCSSRRDIEEEQTDFANSLDKGAPEGSLSMWM